MARTGRLARDRDRFGWCFGAAERRGLPCLRCSAAVLALLVVGMVPSGVEAAWQRLIGGSLGDGARAVAAGPSGGILVAGFRTAAPGDTDGWVASLDGAGTVLWEVRVTGGGEESLHGIIALPDGAAVVGRRALGGSPGDVWVVRLDGRGRVVWQTTFDAGGDDSASGVSALPGGGFIVVGGTTHPTTGETSGWVAALSDDGRTAWRVVPTEGQSGWLYGATASSGMIYAVGETGTPGQGVVAIIDPHSGGVRRRQIGGTGRRRLVGVGNIDGGWYVAGVAWASPQERPDGWVLSVDAEGQPLWQSYAGGTADDAASAVIARPEGGAVVAGTTASDSAGGDDIWVFAIDRDGAILWERRFGGPGRDAAFGLVAGENGDIFVVGESDQGGDADIWIARLNPDGTGLD